MPRRSPSFSTGLPRWRNKTVRAPERLHCRNPARFAGNETVRNFLSSHAHENEIAVARILTSDAARPNAVQETRIHESVWRVRVEMARNHLLHSRLVGDVLLRAVAAIVVE